MFKDYYAILGISPNATQEEIHKAYRRCSKQWHPDRNPDRDTEELMKDINEAYSILKDPQKRERYDKEYTNLHFKSYSEESSSHSNSNNPSNDANSNKKRQSYSYNYDVKDDNLRNDINKARKEAEDFVNEFFSHLKDDSKRAAEGAWKAIKPFLILCAISLGIAILVGIISGIAFAL